MGEMRILCSEGDRKHIWDPKINDEVEDAKKSFKRMIKKGYKAFEVGRGGKKSNREVKEFDPSLGQLIMVPVIAGG
jgi:hypothetical protein